MSLPPYELRRSARRTLSMEVTREGNLLVRAPYRLPRAEIERFVASHEAWIATHTAMIREKHRRLAALSEEEIARLKAHAKEVLFPMTERYAAALGVTYRTLKITSAKTRFGSCSKNGGICYSYRLLLYPRESFDYIVVHELCHRLHFDHSPAFYAEIARVLPDWKARRALLAMPTGDGE